MHIKLAGSHIWNKGSGYVQRYMSCIKKLSVFQIHYKKITFLITKTVRNTSIHVLLKSLGITS